MFDDIMMVFYTTGAGLKPSYEIIIEGVALNIGTEDCNANIVERNVKSIIEIQRFI